jgi:WD40-like Beta Propeller Repeat
MNNKIAASIFAIFILITFTCFKLEAQEFTEWSTPVNMGPSINTEFSDFHTAISADGRSIFVASDRPDGFGDFDFWTAHRPNRNAAWGIAQNVGPVINTDFGEFAPELTVDGH